MKTLLPLLALAAGFLAFNAGGCAALWPTPVEDLTVERSTIDPPAGAILERLMAYAEADDDEDPLVWPTTWNLYQALNGPEPIKVAPWAPLASGGLLQEYYRAQTRGDAQLLPETIEGRVLAAELLGEALARVLNP